MWRPEQNSTNEATMEMVHPTVFMVALPGAPLDRAST
jgi:hypothetical protein